MEVISGGRISVNKLFFPLLLFIVSAVTYFNLFGKLLQLLRISSFDPQQSDGADIVIAEGKSLIKRERRIRRSTRRKSANP